MNNEPVQQYVFLWLEEAFTIIASCIVSAKYRGNNLVSDVSKNWEVGRVWVRGWPELHYLACFLEIPTYIQW